ncbi:hypothetical protein [Citricoccus nitrophenolicus]|uniref:hypothetical protein n=1 Tax=Citricoccus nitrophenolicus TaxID=863575 RepID=UPI0031EB31F9
MDTTEHLDLPSLALRLELPTGWRIDDSGLSQGTLIVWDPVDWTGGFQANLVLTQAALTANTTTDLSRMLVEQQAVEPVLAGELQDYRVLHLGADAMGRPSLPAVHRLSIYTTAPGVPVTMAQWLARSGGLETTLTFTFPTADSGLGIDGARGLAAQLEWTGMSA